MPSDYKRILDRVRDESRQIEEVFRVRYSSGPPAAALRLARLWRSALSSEPLDWAELSAIRDEARENKSIADVAFFAFINQLERDFS